MASSRSVDRDPVSPRPDELARAQLARVSGSGCASHPHLAALLEGRGPHSGRDLADAVHLLCSLHGRHPGVIELALTHSSQIAAHAWLTGASDAFERERLYLVRLTDRHVGEIAEEQCHVRLDLLEQLEELADQLVEPGIDALLGQLADTERRDQADGDDHHGQ